MVIDRAQAKQRHADGVVEQRQTTHHVVGRSQSDATGKRRAVGARALQLNQNVGVADQCVGVRRCAGLRVAVDGHVVGHDGWQARSGADRLDAKTGNVELDDERIAQGALGVDFIDRRAQRAGIARGANAAHPVALCRVVLAARRGDREHDRHTHRGEQRRGRADSRRDLVGLAVGAQQLLGRERRLRVGAAHAARPHARSAVVRGDHLRVRNVQAAVVVDIHPRIDSRAAHHPLLARLRPRQRHLDRVAMVDDPALCQVERSSRYTRRVRQRRRRLQLRRRRGKHRTGRIANLHAQRLVSPAHADGRAAGVDESGAAEAHFDQARRMRRQLNRRQLDPSAATPLMPRAAAVHAVGDWTRVHAEADPVRAFDGPQRLDITAKCLQIARVTLADPVQLNRAGIELKIGLVASDIRRVAHRQLDLHRRTHFDLPRRAELDRWRKTLRLGHRQTVADQQHQRQRDQPDGQPRRSAPSPNQLPADCHFAFPKPPTNYS